MTSFRSLGCLVVISFAALSVSAQQITGSIRGTVTEASGAVVQAFTTGATLGVVTSLVGAITGAADTARPPCCTTQAPQRVRNAG